MEKEVGIKLNYFVMKFKLGIWTLVILIISLLYFSCQEDLEETPALISRAELVNRITDAPSNRLQIWNELSDENKYLIWMDKFDHLIANDELESEKKEMIRQLREKLSKDLYLQALQDFNSVSYISEWFEEFKTIASSVVEAEYIMGTLRDYEKADLERLEKGESLDLKSERINGRSDTGGGSVIETCNCRWSVACELTPGQDCCSGEDHSVCDCAQTGNGCGLLFLQRCTKLCIDEILIYN